MSETSHSNQTWVMVEQASHTLVSRYVVGLTSACKELRSGLFLLPQPWLHAGPHPIHTCSGFPAQSTVSFNTKERTAWTLASIGFRSRPLTCGVRGCILLAGSSWSWRGSWGEQVRREL